MVDVINVDRNVGGPAELARAFGRLGGNIAGQWNQADALQKAENMPEEQAASYLMQRLGPEGAKFAAQLTEQKLAKKHMEQVDEGLKLTAAQVKNETEKTRLLPLEFALKQSKNQAEIAAERAREASSYAAAAHAQTLAAKERALTALEQERLRAIAAADWAKVEKNKAELEQLNNSIKMSKALMLKYGIDDLSSGTPGQAPGTPPGIPPVSFQQPNARPGAGPAQPLTTENSGLIRPIATTGGPAPAPPPASDGVKETPLRKMENNFAKFEAGEIPKDALVDVTTPTEGMKDEALAALAKPKSDPMGAVKAMNPPRGGVQYMELPSLPGVEVAFTTDSSGRPQTVRGGDGRPLFKDNRKPTPEPENRSATGLAQVAVVTDLMKELRGKADKDPMGGVITRRFNQLLVNNNLSPLGDNPSTRDVRSALYNLSKHQIIGVTGILVGARQTQDLRNQVKDALASAVDDPKLFESKARTTDLILDIQIMSALDTMRKSRQVPPPALVELYKSRNLGSTTLEDLETQYAREVRGGDDGMPRQKTRAGVAPEKVTETASPKNSGVGRYTAADIKKIAQATGSTEEEVIKFLSTSEK